MAETAVGQRLLPASDFDEAGWRLRGEQSGVTVGNARPPEPTSTVLISPPRSCRSKTWGRPTCPDRMLKARWRALRPLQVAAITYCIAFGPRPALHLHRAAHEAGAADRQLGRAVVRDAAGDVDVLGNAPRGGADLDVVAEDCAQRRALGLVQDEAADQDQPRAARHALPTSVEQQAQERDSRRHRLRSHAGLANRRALGCHRRSRHGAAIRHCGVAAWAAAARPAPDALYARVSRLRRRRVRPQRSPPRAS